MAAWRLSQLKRKVVVQIADKRGPQLSRLLSGPKKSEITNCTRKCMPACIRGGEGARWGLVHPLLFVSAVHAIAIRQWHD